MSIHARTVGITVALGACLAITASGCGDGETSSKSSPAPPANVAAAVLLFKANHSLSSGNPALINLAGKVLSRPPIKPVASLAYDGAGALWIAKGELSQRGYFTHGCDLWRVDPPRLVLSYKQAKQMAVSKGLAKAADKTYNLLCAPTMDAKGGLVSTWTPDSGGGNEVSIALPPNAGSGTDATVTPAPTSTAADDYSEGMTFPTWDGAQLRVNASESMGASSVTLERKDGSTQVLWTEAVGLGITEAQISRDGKWLFALAGAYCGTCEPDLYRAAIADGPAGATPDGAPHLMRRRVKALAIPPPAAGATVLPSASGTDTTGGASESTGAPPPADLLVSGADLPVDYSDMGDAASSEGLSQDFVIPGDPCQPADLSYQVRYSAEQVLTGPGGITTSATIMDMNTRENALGGLRMLRDAGRSCATGPSGQPSLVGGGIAAKIEWHAPATIDGDFTIVSTTLSQATGMDQILTHGGATMFAQGPYLVEIHALNVAERATKVTDPLTLDSDIGDILSTVAQAQKDKIRLATGNPPT